MENESIIIDLNVNETAEAELLSDLFVENDSQIKGGPYECPLWRCGFNHNETTAEDEDNDLLQFADLDLTDKQLAEIKGGPGGGWGCGACSTGLGNHNETTVEDEDDDLLQFADLDLTDEQLTEIKGGPGNGWGCSSCTSGLGNHNETMVEDDDAKTGSLACL